MPKEKTVYYFFLSGWGLKRNRSMHKISAPLVLNANVLLPQQRKVKKIQPHPRTCPWSQTHACYYTLIDTNIT